MRLDGLVALVSGAGRGLGRSHALLLGALGAKVLVNDTGKGLRGDGEEEEVARTVAEEIIRHGGKAAWSTRSAVDGDKLVEEAVQRFGRIDVLVLNAGILRSARLERMSDVNFDLMWQINMMGAYSAARAAVPHFVRQGYGRVIFTSSSSGVWGSFGGSNYGTCKYSLIGLLLSLSSQLAALPGDISASALLPGAATRMGGTVLGSGPAPEFGHPDLVSPVVAMLAGKKGAAQNGSPWYGGFGWFARLELEPRVDVPRIYAANARQAFRERRVVVVGIPGKSMSELCGRLESGGAKVGRVEVDGFSEEALEKVVGGLGGVDLCMFDWSEAPLASTYPWPTTADPDPALDAAKRDFAALHDRFLRTTFRACRLIYPHMRKVGYGRFVAFVRVDLGNEAPGVVGPEWNSVAFGIQGLLQVLSIESASFSVDISGSSLFLHPLAQVDSHTEGVRPAACLPVAAATLVPGFRGREAAVFNGTPFGWRVSPGFAVALPEPGNEGKHKGTLWNPEGVMRELEGGWEQAGDVYAEDWFPKDEPAIMEKSMDNARKWLAKHFPDYEMPSFTGAPAPRANSGGTKL
ncbi:hypothetical protein DFJ74DRAFT_682022 [Hyaloraphidium curvatum]|nr:hypothetical protein DFJ74DRAFT_682022 [Hyaloraphidium curvatum]